MISKNKSIKFSTNELNLIKIFFIISIILVFTLPVIFFGIMDIEDYEFGFFSSRIIADNNLNPFTFFSDSIGPGINIPMGNGVFFHPLLIFANNIKLFYFLITICHLSLQSFYFIKINKLLGVKNYVIFFIPLIIFSNTNFNSHYSDDWITATSNFTFAFIVSYYFLKILKKNLLQDYVKFSIFFFLFVENGHVGFIFFTCIFLIVLFIFSINKLQILKDYKLFLFFVILILLLSEKFYYFLSIFIESRSYKEIIDNEFYVDNPGFIDFTKSLFPTEYFRSINRLPSNPYLIILALVFIFAFKKKESFINLKYIFVITLIFNFTPILELFSTVMSASWWIRDFILILSCLICLQYFSQLNKILKVLLIFFLFSYSTLYFAKNFSGIINNSNNFIVDKPNDLTMISFFKNLKLNKNFNRVYLSPETYKLLSRNNSAEYGIYTAKDLIKFNLSPFNLIFKNNLSTMRFEQPPYLKYYYSGIIPNIEDMNNLFFLSIFHINYSFLSEYELVLLDPKNFDVIDVLALNSKKFYFIKNKINLLSIKDPEELNKRLDKCRSSILICLNNEKKSFYKINGNFIKEKNSYYQINNLENSDLQVIIPFVFDKNWSCNSEKCLKIGNFLTYSKNNGKNIVIKYKDEIRFLFRLLSLITLVSLILFLIFYKKKFNSN